MKKLMKKLGYLQKREVIDWRANSQFNKTNPKIKDFSPRIEITGKSGKALKLSVRKHHMNYQ